MEHFEYHHLFKRAAGDTITEGKATWNVPDTNKQMYFQRWTDYKTK